MSFCLSSRFCSVPLFAFVLAAGLSACSAEQAPEGAETTDAASTLDDAGLAVPDASPAGTRQSDAGATLPVEDPSALTTLAEFRGTVDVANGTMELTLLEGRAVTDPGLRRAQQGLCALTIVQDGVPGSGPVNSLELVTGSTGLDSDCDGYFASPLFCGAVTVRSFYLTPYDQVFAQILTLAPSTGFTVQNGDLVPGASSGLGSWAYGDLAASSAAPANAGVRNWVFARSGGNFTFTGRLVANVPELCDGLDNDCDGLTDEGAACTPQGGNCATDADCLIGLVCGAGLCGPSECPAGEHLESGFCISDIRACTVSGGVGSQGWDGAAWATCLPTSCDAGYALRSDSCQRVLCGDGFTEGAEGCDDAGFSNGDGCSVVCTIEAGYLCAGQPSLCAPLICNPGYHTVGTTCVRNPVAYVVNQYTSDVSVIDTMTQTVTATIPVGAHPTRVAVNGAGTTAYVTNQDGSAVSVIDTATNTVTSTIPVGYGPTGVALSPTATTAFVTSYFVSEVSVIDTATNAVTASVTVGASPNRVAVNPSGTRAYIADSMFGGVSVLDTATNTIVATISVEDSTSSGPGYTPTADVAVNPAGTLAYALIGGSFFSPNDMFSKIVVIDLATNTVIARVPVGGIAYSEEGAIVVNRAGTLVYAANWQGGTVTVFDTATNTVTATIPVESQPQALSMGTTDATLYVANRASDSVSVIDTTTNTVTASIHVGIWPSGIAVFSSPTPGLLGATCTINAECASGFCATGPEGTTNDRCAPQGMNYLPPATYGMGSPDTELGHQSSETLHAVTLTRGFFIGTTEVTQGQWKALSGGVNAACYQDETSASCSLGNSNDNGPVEMVDWYAAAAFANARSAAEGLTACYNLQGCADPIDGWKDGAHTGCTGATFAGVSCEGYRLPTESESQYAVRGGTTTATFGGNLNTDVGCVTVSGAGSILSGTALSDLGWYNCDAGGRTHAVAGKVANSFGLYDVLGNVWEWTGDWQGLYPSGPVTDPTGPVSGAERVLSGSSWNGHAGITRSAERGSFGSGSRAGDVGFRLVRTAQ